MLLPHAEPIPPEHMETAQLWIPVRNSAVNHHYNIYCTNILNNCLYCCVLCLIQVLGEEIVSCLFSKNWVVREIALKQLGRVAVGALLLGVGEGRTGVVLSPSRRHTTHGMLRCCCSVLAHICADPVYKVFVAALVSLHDILFILFYVK